MHPFEHIMPGPYNFVGVRDVSLIQDRLRDSMLVAPEEGDCIGSCDHCGTAISVAVLIKGKNGVFKTGETCAKKVSEAEPLLYDRVKKACNKRRNEIKKTKTSLLAENFTAKMNATKDLPHPKGWGGKTLFDYLSWYKANAGDEKFVQICKQHIN